MRDKLARKLEEHADEVVAAYLAGIRSDDPNRAYRAADDPLDVMQMTRKQLDALKRELLRQHPELAERYMGSRVDEEGARTPATAACARDPNPGRLPRSSAALGDGALHLYSGKGALGWGLFDPGLE